MFGQEALNLVFASQHSAYLPHVSPSCRVGCANANVEQDVSRHPHVSVEAPIHDERTKLACIAEYGYADTKTTCRNSPQDDDSSNFSAMHERILVKEGPPEKEPEAIVTKHHQHLHDEGRAILHR